MHGRRNNYGIYYSAIQHKSVHSFGSFFYVVHFFERSIIMNKGRGIVMYIDKLLSVIGDRSAFQCKFDEKRNQLTLQIEKNNKLIYKPELVGKLIIRILVPSFNTCNKSILISNHIIFGKMDG